MNQNSWSFLFLTSWLVGCVLLFRGGQAVYEAVGSRKWPASAGRIVESNALLVSHRGSFGKKSYTYELRISFEYAVNGKSYAGHRVSFNPWGPKQNLNPFNRFTSRRYPLNAAVQVLYDPEDPSNSVLEPGIKRSSWIALLLGYALFRFGFLCRQRVRNSIPSDSPIGGPSLSDLHIGNTAPTPPRDLDQRLKSLLRAGNKIEAIKLCHKETGLGLKASKEHVESLENHGGAA